MEAWVQLIIAQGGAVGVLAIWLWVERQSRLEEREERRALQQERDALLERVLKGLNDSQMAVIAAHESQQATHATLATVRDIILAGSGGGVRGAS